MEGLISAHPKSRKIAKLVGSGVLEMQELRFTQLNIPPTSQYELYSRKLKQLQPSIAQIGLPSDDDRREVEVLTDPIEVQDKEVQFCYEDDTLFHNVLRAVERRRHSESSAMSLLEEAKRGETHQSPEPSSLLNERLTEFLQRASFICETLIEERNLRETSLIEDKQGSSHLALFDVSTEWQSFGSDEANGGNEVLRTRKPTLVRFSKIQPHLVLVAYPPVDNPDDLFPGKVRNQLSRTCLILIGNPCNLGHLYSWSPYLVAAVFWNPHLLMF